MTNKDKIKKAYKAISLINNGQRWIVDAVTEKYCGLLTRKRVSSNVLESFKQELKAALIMDNVSQEEWLKAMERTSQNRPYRPFGELNGLDYGQEAKRPGMAYSRPSERFNLRPRPFNPSTPRYEPRFLVNSL